MSDALPARWRATTHYRTDSGLVDVEHEIRELGEIELIVERGPHWDTIDRIEIVRINHVEDPAMTVEQAKEL